MLPPANSYCLSLPPLPPAAPICLPLCTAAPLRPQLFPAAPRYHPLPPAAPSSPLLTPAGPWTFLLPTDFPATTMDSRCLSYLPLALNTDPRRPPLSLLFPASPPPPASRANGAARCSIQSLAPSLLHMQQITLSGIKKLPTGGSVNDSCFSF